MSQADDVLGPGLGFEKGAAADGAPGADDADGNGATSFSQTAWRPNTALHSSALQLRSTH